MSNAIRPRGSKAYPCRQLGRVDDKTWSMITEACSKSGRTLSDVARSLLVQWAKKVLRSVAKPKSDS